MCALQNHLAAGSVMTKAFKRDRNSANLSNAPLQADKKHTITKTQHPHTNTYTAAIR